MIKKIKNSIKNINSFSKEKTSIIEKKRVFWYFYLKFIKLIPVKKNIFVIFKNENNTIL